MTYCVARPDRGDIVWRSGVSLSRAAAAELAMALGVLTVHQEGGWAIDDASAALKALNGAITAMGWSDP